MPKHTRAIRVLRALAKADEGLPLTQYEVFSLRAHPLLYDSKSGALTELGIYAVNGARRWLAPLLTYDKVAIKTRAGFKK